VTLSTPAASTIHEPVAAGAESPADPVLAELEAALELRRTGADAKALRRALRRIEELLDE
jgi:citrate lyase beta subunit